MNEKILKGFDYLIIFGFYGFIVCLVIGALFFIWAIYFSKPGIDPTTTPEWKAKEKEYFDQRDENGELIVWPQTTRTECPYCAHETIVGSNVDVFCHSCGEVYSVDGNISKQNVSLNVPKSEGKK